MKKHILLGFLVVAGLCGLVLVHPAQVTADDFNMNFIVTDSDFTDASSMSATKIQQFLDLQSGILKSYQTTVSDGSTQTAAQIIAAAAQQYTISPKVILTTLQKESSILTRTDFGSRGQQYYLDWAAFYGWCDSCTTGTNKGFVNQVNAMAGAFRRYLNAIAAQGYSVSYWGPNIAKNLPCISSDAFWGLCQAGTTITITPVNAATSALYTYTPHPGGNRSFWKIWNDNNFGVKRLYPDGSVLQAKGTSDIYVIQGGLKRKFVSMAAFLSRYTYNNIIKVSADQLFFYDDGSQIKFANYSLLKNPTGGIYLLVDDTIRPIPTRAAFKAAGFTGDPVIKVKWSDLAAFQEGEAITTDNIYPSGRLMKDKSNGMVFYVKDGVRHPIPSKQIYTSQFGQRKSVPTSRAVLSTFTWGNDVGFKDGELVQLKGANGRGSGPVYFISNGQRLTIGAPSVAKAYNFNLKNVILTNQASLDVHPLGQALSVDPIPVVQAASK